MKYIYDIISTEEKNFHLPIPITDSWEWNFPDHVKTTVHYKNSIFKSGYSESRPFKNIFRFILNLQYRAEGFDVKEILLYVNDKEKQWKSLLLKKYHEYWQRENKVDEFIDKLVESYVDFGGVLVKKTANNVPEVVPLQRIAFCDQSDMLAGPIAEVHFYSPDELREEAKKRNWKNVEEVIALAEKSRDVGRTRKANTPGKRIKVYEIHGTFPRYCLNDYEYEEENGNGDELIGQVHICSLYKNDEEEYVGITLFKGEEKKSPYKLLLRDPIYGRALGLGGGEELFQDQIWTNYGMIRLKQLLDAASKIVYKTTDPKFANRNKTDDLENGEILVLENGTDIQQIDTIPRSAQLFDRFVQEFEIHAQKTGGATEAALGNPPTAGTPFKSLELQVAESHSLHEYRKGKIARFVEEIYNDWIIPQMAKEIVKGNEFIADLDADELRSLASALAENQANKFIKDSVLNGFLPSQEVLNDFKKAVKAKFLAGGNKKIFKILEDEFKNLKFDVQINIAGKQKDLTGKVDKLVNVLRFMLSTYDPNTGQFAIFNDARMTKLFSQIIEASGLNPLDFEAPPDVPAGEQSGANPPAGTGKSLEKLSQRPTITEEVSNL